MSQIYKSSSAGPIGPNIEEIIGDTGSITGNIVTIYAHRSTQNSGSTVGFDNSGTISTLNVTDSSGNTIIGKSAGNASITGSLNTGLGFESLLELTSSSSNVAIGDLSLALLTSGSGGNTSIGSGTLSNLGTGTGNTCIGFACGEGYTTTESNNIILGNNIQGSVGESNVIRIGNVSNNKCFITGIDGVNVGSVAKVVTETSNQLGTATLTAGTGITITPTANVITISASSSGFTWTDVTGATQTIAAENGYITDRGGGVTYTLPASGSLGDTFKIVGKLGLATITPNANQQLLIGSASGTVGVTGTAVSNNAGDCIEFVVITSGASTVWRASSVVGNWTLN